MRRPRALAVVGPTASGKTGLSLALARDPGGEVVSMDSRQVYRGMDIGTAKATAGERRRVPHHGLDLVDPGESYSAGRFGRDARGWIEDIRGRGLVPLLVGGSGFFLRAVTDPVFRQPPLDGRRLKALRRHLSALPRETLERWVEVLDPERQRVAAEGGPQRLARTLEVALLTGRPLSWWHREAPPDADPVPVLVVLMVMPRDELDRRIDARTERMVEEGLVDEVRGLLAAGVSPDAPGMTGVGYREIVRYLEGAWSLEEALDRIRRSTRRYARRQLTWYRNQLPASGVLRVDARRPPDELAPEIARAWRRAEARGLEPVGGGGSAEGSPGDDTDGGVG